MANDTKIPLFRRFVIQNFPYIEQDFDALTDYQLISKVVEYLNKVIESQNGLVDDMNDLETAFNTLKDYVDHYFDNLDVQEEINNKLDEMADSGELTELITAYLQTNASICFDTVADMKSSTILVNGSYARTLGFRSLNDGGDAIYKITDSGTANEMDIIAVGDLKAHLIYGKNIDVKKLGAYGDDSHDDSSYINQALTLANVIYLPDYTYYCGSTITISGNKHFTCDGTIHSGASYAVTITNRQNNVKIYKIIGDDTNTAVLLAIDGNNNNSQSNFEFNSIDHVVDGIILNSTNGKGIMYNNFRFNYIKATDTGIKLMIGDTSNGYVSENNFYGGRLTDGGSETGTGVKMIKGANQTNPFAYNKFIHVGFETINCDANIQLAVRNLFLSCRTSEGVSGDYNFIVSEDSRDNLFDCSYLEITKINDVNNVDRAFNTYKAHRLTINGTAYANEMRIFKGKKIFSGKWDYTQYATLVDLYNIENGQVSADYYYNGMIIQAGGDEDGTYVVTLDEAFDACGVTDFYLFVKNKTVDSTLKIQSASGSLLVKTGAFSGALVKKLYHITKVDRVGLTNGSNWAVTVADN